jgi:hypothetical protein
MTPMIETKYLWQAAYLAAVCETDDDEMPGRILEALAALEQRLLTLGEIDAEELKALKDAQDGLEGLKVERVIQAHRSASEPAFTL